ncbi:AAA family ATPase [Nocardia sp. 2]|uniref:AAA family ATPase n=1 Tax=Nocardia acididurans TaxID=2802282 RepID=A0ABS1M467_9NOCA|nr:LuxR family transcriptional regulator [Nocardia acididurans]MBL1075453.1 AAA family ATPase [Nocardia acididurans]
MLYGRQREERRISTLLAGAVHGQSGAVAVVAGPGEGKSALLERAAELAGSRPETLGAPGDPAHPPTIGDPTQPVGRADPPRRGVSADADAPGASGRPGSTGLRADGAGWLVLRCTGMETGAELAFSGLRTLLEPALGHRGSLPEPQGRALAAALGLADGEREPERFLVGLATLSLLAEVSAAGPVLCLIDDAQWLDQPSVDALLFTARRLGDEGIVVLFAGRPDFTAAGLEVLQPAPLDAQAARALLAEHSPELPVELRDRVLVESAGNPLALLELPGMNLDSPPVGPLALSERLQSGYREHIGDLPDPARLALLVSAADETGDLGLVLNALAALGFGAEALADAERTTLVAVSGQTVSFRHPLVRAAAYRIASEAERVAVHSAMADALAAIDPDRRTWHRAAAATGPDESVAAALEVSALRARDRTGYGAAATAWERSAQLTPDPGERVRRLVCAVETASSAGQFARARRLGLQVTGLETCPEFQARVASVLAHIEFEHGSPVTAHQRLRSAAAAVAATAPDQAAALLLDAGRITWSTGDLTAFRHCRDLLAALPTSPDRNSFLHAYDGLLGIYDDDPTPGIALLRAVVAEQQRHRDRTPAIRFALATQAIMLGDVETARDVLSELAESCRLRGQLGWLAAVELWLGTVELIGGRFREATLLSVEGRRMGESIDQPIRIVHAAANLALIAAIAGDEQRCLELVETTRANPRAAAVHHGLLDWAVAQLDMACGRHVSALDRLEALDRTPLYRHGQWVLAHADRVEAAVRANQPGRAATALAELRVWASALQAPWAEALLLRCLGLLHNDPAAFTRALELHARQGRWFDRARTGLLFGEWLRRERRTAEARAELRDALEAFERLGAHAWADRARHELRAAGEGAVPQVNPCMAELLTPQELQVTRLAASGATNKEIAARLFLSPKTVGHHLSRAFRKLGVSSRVDLARLELD